MEGKLKAAKVKLDARKAAEEAKEKDAHEDGTKKEKAEEKPKAPNSKDLAAQLKMARESDAKEKKQQETSDRLTKENNAK